MNGVILKTVLQCECGEIIHGVRIRKERPVFGSFSVLQASILPSCCPKCKRHISSVVGPKHNEEEVKFY